MKLVGEEINEYCELRSTSLGKTCEMIRKFTLDNKGVAARMLTGDMVASFLAFMVKTAKARSILEVGTFTGYATVAMAEALPENGKITTLDIDPQTESLKEIWKNSESFGKINLIIGNAHESIEKLEDKLDLVFIDADKKGYRKYLEKSLELLNEDGVIILDNVLWSGRVLDKDQDDTTKAISDLNEYIANRSDIEKILLPIRDGLFLVRKKWGFY